MERRETPLERRGEFLQGDPMLDRDGVETILHQGETVDELRLGLSQRQEGPGLLGGLLGSRRVLTLAVLGLDISRCLIED
jgi:hypothetical protein